jgi:hypothetical protein
MYNPCTLGMSICRMSCAAYGFHDAAPDSHGTTPMSRHWMSEYAAAYYWASMTVTTIGYGDIVRSCCVSYRVGAAAMFVASVFTPCSFSPLSLALHPMQIPQTTFERMIATLCMLAGASIFAYVVSSIVAIVASFGEERRQCVAPHCSHCCSTCDLFSVSLLACSRYMP